MSRIIITIAILLSLDILAAGLLWYGYATMQTKKGDEAKQREELVAEEGKRQKLTALSRSIALAGDDRKLLAKYLFDPREENQIRFISQIEGLGQLTGALVTVSSLNVSGSSVHAEVVLKGKWREIYHTLRLVEELPTRTEVNRFGATRGALAENTQEGQEEWTSTLSLDITSLQPIR